MRTSFAPALFALAVVVAADSALAQSNPIAREAAPANARAAAPGFQLEGFFRPTPDGDPSLTRYRPPASVQIQSSQPVFARPASPAMPVSAPAMPEAPVTRGPDSNPASAPAAIETQRWTEEQLDRTEREAERDRARAAALPPPVAPGAYDGTTSERNR